MEVDIQQERDVIIEQFIRQCPMPSTIDILSWQKRHPAHAKAILAFAIDVIDTTLIGGGSLAPDRRIIDRRLRRAFGPGRQKTAPNRGADR